MQKFMIYVDDIVITRYDITIIAHLKKHLFSHFQTKYLGYLKYLVDVEGAQSKGVIISQRKYALDILEETGMENCKPIR